MPPKRHATTLPRHVALLLYGSDHTPANSRHEATPDRVYRDPTRRGATRRGSGVAWRGSGAARRGVARLGESSRGEASRGGRGGAGQGEARRAACHGIVYRADPNSWNGAARRRTYLPSSTAGTRLLRERAYISTPNERPRTRTCASVTPYAALCDCATAAGQRRRVSGPRRGERKTVPRDGYGGRGRGGGDRGWR